MNTITFYHAGCPICVDAEQQLLGLINTQQFNVDVVHLGEQPQKITTAEAAGVKSVPALVIGENVLHINFGAALSDLH